MKKNHTVVVIFAWTALLLFGIALFSWCFAAIFSPSVEIVPEPPQVSTEVLAYFPQKQVIERDPEPYEFCKENEDAFLVDHRTLEEKIDDEIYDICADYPNVDPEVIRAQVFNESTYNPNAVNADGSCVGLMQVSTFWHKDRAIRLGVTDFYDIRGNLLLGIDYMSELIGRYGDVTLALMLYSDNHDLALSAYSNGDISPYAKAVISLANKLRDGGGCVNNV